MFRIEDQKGRTIRRADNLQPIALINPTRAIKVLGTGHIGAVQTQHSTLASNASAAAQAAADLARQYTEHPYLSLFRDPDGGLHYSALHYATQVDIAHTSISGMVTDLTADNKETRDLITDKAQEIADDETLINNNRLLIETMQGTITTAEKAVGDLANDAIEAAGDAGTARDDAETFKDQAEDARDEAAEDLGDVKKLVIEPEDSQATLTDGTQVFSALHYNAKVQEAYEEVEEWTTNFDALEEALDTKTTNFNNQVAEIEALVANLAGIHDDFHVRFIGNFENDNKPTTRADGTPLVNDDLYYDTSLGQMRQYVNGFWVNVRQTQRSSVRHSFLFIAVESGGSVSHTFTGLDSRNQNLVFDSNNVDVYLNGVLLHDEEYDSASVNNQITINQDVTLEAGDIIAVIAYQALTSGDFVSALGGGTFGGDVAFERDIRLEGQFQQEAISPEMKITGQEPEFIMEHKTQLGSQSSGDTQFKIKNTEDDVILDAVNNQKVYIEAGGHQFAKFGDIAQGDLLTLYAPNVNNTVTQLCDVGNRFMRYRFKSRGTPDRTVGEFYASPSQRLLAGTNLSPIDPNDSSVGRQVPMRGWQLDVFNNMAVGRPNSVAMPTGLQGENYAHLHVGRHGTLLSGRQEDDKTFYMLQNAYMRGDGQFAHQHLGKAGIMGWDDGEFRITVRPSAVANAQFDYSNTLPSIQVLDNGNVNFQRDKTRNKDKGVSINTHGEVLVSCTENRTPLTLHRLESVEQTSNSFVLVEMQLQDAGGDLQQHGEIGMHRATAFGAKAYPYFESVGLLDGTGLEFREDAIIPRHARRQDDTTSVSLGTDTNKLKDVVSETVTPDLVFAKEVLTESEPVSVAGGMVAEFTIGDDDPRILRRTAYEDESVAARARDDANNVVPHDAFTQQKLRLPNIIFGGHLNCALESDISVGGEEVSSTANPAVVVDANLKDHMVLLASMQWSTDDNSFYDAEYWHVIPQNQGIYTSSEYAGHLLGRTEGGFVLPLGGRYLVEYGVLAGWQSLFAFPQAALTTPYIYLRLGYPERLKVNSATAEYTLHQRQYALRERHQQWLTDQYYCEVPATGVNAESKDKVLRLEIKFPENCRGHFGRGNNEFGNLASATTLPGYTGELRSFVNIYRVQD